MPSELSALSGWSVLLRHECWATAWDHYCSSDTSEKNVNNLGAAVVLFKPLQNQQKSVLCILLSPPHPSQPVNQGCIPFHVSEVSKANTKADLQYSKSHWAAVNFLGNEKKWKEWHWTQEFSRLVAPFFPPYLSIKESFRAFNWIPL